MCAEGRAEGDWRRRDHVSDLESGLESANQRREENVPKRSGRHIVSDIALSVSAGSALFASLNCNVS